MAYLRPAGAVPISSSWQDHKDRNPPSGEPGTDYACSYGTGILAADPGVVVDLSTSTAGGTGRYVTVDLDDSRRVRYLHLSQVWVYVGQRVSRGQTIAASGASGFGSDYGYGAHVHTTLFPGHSYDFGNTLDFARYTGEDDDMPLNADTDYPAFSYMLWRALKWDVRDGANGPGADAALGSTMWDRFGRVDNAIATIELPTGGGSLDYDELAKSLVEQGIQVVVIQPPPLGRARATSSRLLYLLASLAVVTVGLLAWLAVTLTT